ncbi:DegT/DnrJ/EryC1/StrS family aminotransferase [Microbacterium azadirachtae]|uniref:UDP-4-amino-4-deoxy-L-arabinose--oxoglutarate aminotransferase n=1 Tax=Microbacterium azadirachtae TaxID=582680 RepID=A0A0F0KKW1_9MICO|nr:DegT/DnrJ/EryC1/StrS family aminotransferase [Microbacterium azadirachtae]KJL21537.1 UDP-4-amino-4-deoxy-L-arabinose--oxoglutarate aminotransferase [Microbacterium azadirachtae]UXW84860.1 DegT/DnrJ/EryC1/StrS family aminotransferase [Microbacterium azadirachtae]SDM51210.1 dTDP-4-amino-4,6-dideoxygalactose transaminase [Microbacterium azadirachtae]SEG58468.1 dTDP-4-amino-4,6-dideoxygalactose transaminase [Microbacterium azadirachtae]SEG63237.1 dTDP-4-amino-4,6-dideoxygalactose transaminase [
MIPITHVRFGAEEEALVLEVLRSGLIAQGPKVALLEKEFSERYGSKHAVAVNNGTTALIAALQVLDLEPGDEVITTPFTFVATLNAILQSGATAVFADAREDDFNIDPDALAAAVTDRTRVVAPVHLYGQMADMDPIQALADSRGLRILEDSAQAQGATYRGRYAGSYGLGTFSFYATKNMTTGEGGMITTDDDALADRLRLLRNQGMRARYQYEMAGNNYRLTDLQAALALPQIARYEDTVARRRHNAARLSSILDSVAGIEAPREAEGRGHVWHQYTIRVTEEAGITRDALAAELTERGIGNGIYYPKLTFDYDAYRNNPQVRISDVPVAARLAEQALSLPVHAALTDDELDQVAETVAAIVAERA